MPRQLEWFQHLDNALAALRALPCPVVDRSAIEQLFQLSRRSAIRFCHRFGGFQSSNTFLLDRQELIRQLEDLQTSDRVRQETRRRRRIAEELQTIQQNTAAALRVPIRRDVFCRRLEELPEAVQLEPGRLLIRFTRVEDLMQALMELAMAISNDLSGFRRKYEEAARRSQSEVAEVEAPAGAKAMDEGQ